MARPGPSPVWVGPGTDRVGLVRPVLISGVHYYVARARFNIVRRRFKSIKKKNIKIIRSSVFIHKLIAFFEFFRFFSHWKCCMTYSYIVQGVFEIDEVTSICVLTTVIYLRRLERKNRINGVLPRFVKEFCKLFQLECLFLHLR
jgi:hypothetical protein